MADEALISLRALEEAGLQIARAEDVNSAPDELAKGLRLIKKAWASWLSWSVPSRGEHGPRLAHAGCFSRTTRCRRWRPIPDTIRGAVKAVGEILK